MPVYFIRAGENGPVKIGWTDNPDLRLRNLNCGNPDELSIAAVVEGDMATERALHQVFACCRIRGEWFDPIPALTDYIARNAPQDEAAAETDGQSTEDRTAEVASLDHAIAALGSQTALASAIGKKQQHVWYWRNVAGRVPPEIALKIEQATSGTVRRCDLRPDIFDEPPAEVA